MQLHVVITFRTIQPCTVYVVIRPPNKTLMNASTQNRIKVLTQERYMHDTVDPCSQCCHHDQNTLNGTQCHNAKVSSFVCQHSNIRMKSTQWLHTGPETSVSVCMPNNIIEVLQSSCLVDGWNLLLPASTMAHCGCTPQDCFIALHIPSIKIKQGTCYGVTNWMCDTLQQCMRLWTTVLAAICRKLQTGQICWTDAGVYSQHSC